jgi:hypothetical protein
MRRGNAWRKWNLREKRGFYRNSCGANIVPNGIDGVPFLLPPFCFLTPLSLVAHNIKGP